MMHFSECNTVIEQCMAVY